MSYHVKSLATALALIAAPLIATAPVSAQAGQGVGVVDLDAALGNSTAYKAAQAQVQTQFKTQIDAFNARRTAVTAQLEPMGREIQTLQGNSATPQATLQSKVAAYRAREQAANQELAPLAAPFQRPLAYAQAQAAAKLDQAVRAAMTANRIGVLVKPEAVVMILPTADITAAVTTQLDALVKTVSITPPAGWQPGQPVPGSAPAAQGR